MSDQVGLAIRELHRAEDSLASALLHMADRHKADHEIFHVARDIARWSQEHVRELARAGAGHGVELDPEPSSDGDGIVSKARQKGSELVGRRGSPALLLLADLRHVHRVAAGVSLDWEILAQTAQALKDEELLAVCQDCHPQTLRQMRWTNAQLKEQAPQAMVS